MKSLLAILALACALPAYASSYVGAYVNETNGTVLPLALEGRLQGLTNAAATAQARADSAYATATGAVATADSAYDIATNALASATNGVDSAARLSAANAAALATNAAVSAALAGANATNAHLEAMAVGAVATQAQTLASSAVPYTGAASNVDLGNMSLSTSNILSIGTQNPPTNVHPWVTAYPKLFMQGLYGINFLLVGGTTNASTTNGFISMGFGQREFTGRADLWLSSRDTSYDGVDTNLYENSADIFFGRGYGQGNTSINWSVSSRYNYRPDGHSQGRKLAIFQGDGNAGTLAGYPRFLITPNGAVTVARDVYDPEAFSNDAFVVRGLYNTDMRLKTDTNANAMSWARLFMDSGTNSILIRYGDGQRMFGIYPTWLGHDVFIITNSGAVTIDPFGHGTKVGGAFTLGTNAPITNWSDIPVSGDGGATQIVSQCQGYTGTYSSATRTLTMPSLAEGCAVVISPTTTVFTASLTNGTWLWTPSGPSNTFVAPTKASSTNSAGFALTLVLTGTTFTASGWDLPASVTSYSTSTIFFFSRPLATSWSNRVWQ